MDTQEIATLIGKTFLERRDVKAVQFKDGHYEPERSKWKMQDLVDHVEGTRTLGHYLVSPEGNCKFFAFDIDLVKEGYKIILTEDKILNGGEACNPREEWLKGDAESRDFFTSTMTTMAFALAARTNRLLGIPVAVAYSGSKGLHVYGLTGTVPASEAREAAGEVLKSLNCFEATKGDNFFRHVGLGAYRNLEIEVFPKQDNLDGKELGNLMRLPLGVNLKSNQRGFFLDFREGFGVFNRIDPDVALSGELPWDE